MSLTISQKLSEIMRCFDRLCEQWPGLITRDTHEASGMVDAKLKQMPPITV